jgi:DNA-binding transcriptional ArsR family regulator
MLRLVWDRERAASELAEAAQLSRPAASQHLKQLREAGLVTVRVAANRRLYRADLQRVAQVAAFLDEFWAAPLQRLRAAAEERAAGSPSDAGSAPSVPSEGDAS